MEITTQGDILPKWWTAQQLERKKHQHTQEEAVKEYAAAYRQYFHWLDIDPAARHGHIMEIGPADVPATYFIESAKMITIVEPMPSEILEKIMSEEINLRTPCNMLRIPAEYVALMSSSCFVDEFWIFNVLQHTMDPGLIVEQAKRYSKTIRFFEPIGTPIDDCHLHSFTLDWFKGHFGDCVKYYKAAPDVKSFHACDCAYGVWENPIY